MNTFTRTVGSRACGGVIRALIGLLAILALSSPTTPAHADDTSLGTTSTSIMRLGIGARPAALGHAYAAAAGDATTLFVNPAGLAGIQHPQLDLHHQSRFVDTHISSFNLALPIGPAALGIGAGYFDQGHIDEVRDFNFTGNRLHSSELDVAVGAAISVAPHLCVGGRLDIRRTVLVGEFEETGVAGGIGAQLRGMIPRLDLGLAVENLGTAREIDGLEQTAPLPRSLRGGGLLRILEGSGRDTGVSLQLLADVWQARGSAMQLGGGGELALSNLAGSEIGLAGRLGYRGGGKSEELRKLTAGLGLELGFMALDYAFEGFGLLGEVHRFSIDLWPTPPTPPVAPPPSPDWGPDLDGDGVPDKFDNCPATPAGVPVDRCGCAFDSDDDGVVDHADRCPDTPRFVRVDATGCPLPKPVPPRTDLEPVRFNLDRDAIEENDLPHLAEVAKLLRKWPELRLRIAGHADSTGSDPYNLALSERRARAIAEHLLEKYPDIRAERIETVGYGESVPIATNRTPEGRSKNRRASFVVLNANSFGEIPETDSGASTPARQ